MDSKKVEIIIKYSSSIKFLEKELKELNADIEDLGLGYAILTMEKNRLTELYNYEEIIYIEKPKDVFYFLEDVKSSSCFNFIEEKYKLKGRGVLTGILDSGIDYNHPLFRNEKGTKIQYIWDQTEERTPPLGFKYGTEYNEEEINKGLVSEEDKIGHGTAVAGIIASLAPETNFIIVKLGTKSRSSFTLTTEIMRGLKYIYQKAKELNMPLAINLSFGTNNASHDGNSLFESFISDISQTWKSVIVVAMGNEGYAGHHYRGKIKNNEILNIKMKINTSIKTMFLSIWKNFIDSFELEIVAPNGEVSSRISNRNPQAFFKIDTIDVTATFSLPTHYTEKQEVYLYFQRTDDMIPAGIWQLNIYPVDIIDGQINIWMPSVEEVGDDVSFSEPTSTGTITIPATLSRVISVGGYDSNFNVMSSFSGQGMINTEIKPDIVAPAVGINSAKVGGGTDSYSGTSIASPIVCAACILMMEWGIVQKNDVFLYGDKIKSFLKKGANRIKTVKYPNLEWGFGSLCLEETFYYLEMTKKGNFL